MVLKISHGRICSLLDVEQQCVLFFCFTPRGEHRLQFRRELVPAGSTGGLIIYDDRPNYWDAWGTCSYLCAPRILLNLEILDVEIHHLETPHPLKLTNVRVSENGPIRASVVAEVKYGKSTIKTTVCCSPYAVADHSPIRI